MLIVNNISKAYGTQTLFDGASFTVGTGERLGLVGRNGTGKTTLFRMILGEEIPDSGEITIPRGYSIRHLSQHIAFSEKSVLAEAWPACRHVMTAAMSRTRRRPYSLDSGLPRRTFRMIR